VPSLENLVAPNHSTKIPSSFKGWRWIR